MAADVRRYSGRADRDDRVHVVDAGPDALEDPSPYRTRCGLPVLEVYNASEEITCPACAAKD